MAIYEAGFFQNLKKILGDMFHQKKLAEVAIDAQKALHAKNKAETKKSREDEEKQKEERDKKRDYHKAESAEIDKARVDVARSQRAVEVVEKMKKIADRTNNPPPGAGYLVEGLNKDNAAIREIIAGSASAAEVVSNLLTKGNELHGSSRELIKQAQRLSYEAEKQGKLNEINDVLVAISERAKNLLHEELIVRQHEARQRRERGPENIAELLRQDPGIVINPQESADLQDVDPNKQNAAVESLVTKKRDVQQTQADWVQKAVPADSSVSVTKVVAPIDEIWGEVERREASGRPLSTDELVNLDTKIRETENKLFPKDVPSGTESYARAVQSIKAHSEERLNALAQKLSERLASEAPRVREGITNQEEFLMEVVRHKGRLGEQFKYNPEMEKLFFSLTPEGGRFRNRVFLKIHSPIISDQRNSSHDNFGLYERSDFTQFIDMLRIGLGKTTNEKTGESLGQGWADYYNNLSNTIRQARDLDFWASQPAATIENFNKSLGMFQNEFTSHAISLPAVSAAFRAYEATLRSIQDSNDGYIPPAMIEYVANNKGSFWDQRSKEMLKQMVALGAVPELERDSRSYFDSTEADNHTLKLKRDGSGKAIPMRKEDLSEDELNMYMVLAKGFGMASARYLEIFATTRVPGSDHPEMGLDFFHSMPYEGLAKSLNYFNTYVSKWKIGSYKYFHLMNMLVPSDKKKMTINPDDSTEGMKAFMAYQDGTFEEKFGKAAKRFIDSTNFSGISSAIGKDTLWRQYDSSIRWSDRMKEYLGGPTQIALSGRLVKEKVKDIFVVSKYREKYRQEVIARNNKQPGLNLPTVGSGFDKLWEEYGKSKYSTVILQEWDELNGKHPLGKGLFHIMTTYGKKHTPLAAETHHLLEKYETAFKARVWVEMAMRNPLVVAHNLKINAPIKGAAEGKKIKLHKLLVEEILGIPPEDTKYGEMYGKSGFGATPTQKQTDYIKNVLLLEGDIAAVRQTAINEGRDLTIEDFNIISDPARRSNALKYWEKVRLAILGSSDIGQAERLYEKFGLKLLENGQDYAWDNHKIHGINGTLNGLQRQIGNVGTLKTETGETVALPFLLNKAINTSWDWILGTDDMAMEKMDWMNLGSRHWIRRGGDIAAHEAGGNGFVNYMMKGLLPTPDKHECAKLLTEMRDAYSGDMIEVGWSMAGNLAYMTDRLYAWDWARMGSSAQIDIWKTRRKVAAWLANERREWWDTIEHADVIPPHSYFYYYDTPGDKTDIHTLRKICHAENDDVWKEILLLGALIAIAITIYNALTAPMEDEEGSGGGGKGHH
jgi:hypothetical protein